MAAIMGAPAPTAGDDERLPSNEKPEVAADKVGPPPSRSSLKKSAKWWRGLQCIGMNLHFLAPPRPPSPAFTRTIESTLAGSKGTFTLQFYVPNGYNDNTIYDSSNKKASTKHSDSKTSASASNTGSKPKLKAAYPAVINFHGGGFTLGNATDDARFAAYVIDTCQAVFISVDYRLAPEHPFPTAVEDGADAILYVINHAAELKVDPLKLATSGFSAGGNIAITATLRLADYVFQHPRPVVPPYSIRAVAAWYPIIDYTLSRDERRATCAKPELCLSPTLTGLFDASYLFPPDLNLSNPYVSPSGATDEQLARGIPPHVQIFTCEYDMLLKEGADFAKRLQQKPISKDVLYTMIPGVQHGWDKGPNPLKPPEQSKKLYKMCVSRLKDVFDESDS